MTARILIVIVLVIVGLGCATTSQKPAGTVRGPAETVEFYLGNFYRSRMARDLYQTLAPAARSRLPYDEFALQREREIQLPDAGPEAGLARVESAVLGSYRVNERHLVVYALQKVRYPYTAGEHNHYRLVRLHVVNERDCWYVEPFVDERTFTVRLLPALKRDALRKLYDQREAITQLIADDVEAMRVGEAQPVEEVATDTGTLTIPDLPGTVKTIPGEQEAPAAERLAVALEVGRLHFRAGQLDLAEEAFKSALTIDPLNTEAADALDRIRKARQLEKEKQELIELIEQVLEAESDKESN